MEEKQSLLKKKLYDVNLHLKNLNSISSEEIDALKIANNNEIDFFSKNHESLKVSIIKFLINYLMLNGEFLLIGIKSIAYQLNAFIFVFQVSVGVFMSWLFGYYFLNIIKSIGTSYIILFCTH